MSFPVKEKLPGNYFQEVMNAQTVMVRTYLDDLDNPLIFSPFCGDMMASFKFYSDTTEDASPLLHYTVVATYLLTKEDLILFLQLL